MILELKGLTVISDYFVICSGDNIPQVKAIAEHIESELKKIGCTPLSIEGMTYAHWVLMDYGDVVIHIFEDETRSYYELEKLWLDAPRIAVDDEDPDRLARQDQRALSY